MIYLENMIYHETQHKLFLTIGQSILNGKLYVDKFWISDY